MKILSPNNMILLVLWTCAVTGTGCHKLKSKPEISNNKPDKEIPEMKILLPVKFESAHLVTTLKYLDKTALLTEIGNSDGRKDVFSYNDRQQLIHYQRYKNNLIEYSVDYIQNTNGIFTKANQYEWINPKNSTFIGSYTFDYDLKNQLTVIKYYSNNGKELKSTQTMEYTIPGNLTKKTIVAESAPNEVMDFTYDQKNGIFKSVLNVPVLVLEVQNILFTSAINNLLSSGTASTSDDLSFSYEYNADNYPDQCTMTGKDAEKTFKITYMEL